MKLLARGILCPLALIVLIGYSVFLTCGIEVLRIFLDLSFVLVVGGMLLAVWTAYPLGDFFAALGLSLGKQDIPKEKGVYACDILLHAADAAIAMGMIATVLGIVTMVWDIQDIQIMPRGLAFALSGFLFGVFLSEIVFVPLSCRLQSRETLKEEHGKSASKRKFFSLLGLSLCVLGVITVYFVLHLRAI